MYFRDRGIARYRQIESKFETNDLNGVPVYLSNGEMSIILESGRGEISITPRRISKKDAMITREEFDEIYASTTGFELNYDWHVDLSLIDLLALINIHVSVRYSKPVLDLRRDQMGNFMRYENPRSYKAVEQTLYSPEQIQSVLCWGLFWGDKITNFHVNYQDGNDKFITAESKTHYYVLFMGTS